MSEAKHSAVPIDLINQIHDVLTDLSASKRYLVPLVQRLRSESIAIKLKQESELKMPEVPAAEVPAPEAPEHHMRREDAAE